MQFFVMLILWTITLRSTGDESGQQATTKPGIISCIPVRLLSFSVKPDGSSNMLQWQTTSEANAREFIIEKSGDGENFTLYAWVTPKGAVNGPALYRYSDKEGATDAHYRLRMVDSDGKEQVSRTVFLSRKAK